jgi:hypothetical protein
VISPSPRPRSPLRRVRGRGAGSGQRWRHAPPPGRPPCLTCAPPLHPAPRPARPTARASLTPAPTAGCRAHAGVGRGEAGRKRTSAGPSRGGGVGGPAASPVPGLPLSAAALPHLACSPFLSPPRGRFLPSRTAGRGRRRSTSTFSPRNPAPSSSSCAFRSSARIPLFPPISSHLASRSPSASRS